MLTQKDTKHPRSLLLTSTNITQSKSKPHPSQLNCLYFRKPTPPHTLHATPLLRGQPDTTVTGASLVERESELVNLRQPSRQPVRIRTLNPLPSGVVTQWKRRPIFLSLDSYTRSDARIRSDTLTTVWPLLPTPPPAPPGEWSRHDNQSLREDEDGHWVVNCQLTIPL